MMTRKFRFLGDDDPRHMTNMANLGKQKGRSNPLGASRQPNWPGAEGVWSIDGTHNWLVVWNHGILWLSIRLGMSSSQLTSSYFSRWLKPPTRQRCPILWVETLSGGKSITYFSSELTHSKLHFCRGFPLLPCLMTQRRGDFSQLSPQAGIHYINGGLECLMWTMWMRDLELNLW